MIIYDSSIKDRTTQYAKDVVDGKIKAGNYVIKACERHLRDLESSNLVVYQYYFDVSDAEDIICFAEQLEIAEGEENDLVTCYPFQCFILGSLNGWKKKKNRARRFRTSYVQLGRQNGKSFINGILTAYYGNFTLYKNGSLFIAATKQDQANIVFKEITKFIKSDFDLMEMFNIHEYNHTIDCEVTGNSIVALSGDTKSLDGKRPYFAVIDEYHAHRTNQLYKLMEGGIKKVKSALISVITTAGFNLNSPCYKLYEYCCKILDETVDNDSQFVYIAQMNEDDDIYDPNNWVKANPILEFDEDALENLIPVSLTAKEMGGEDLRDFIVKQMNMWVQWSSQNYIKDMTMWKSNKTSKSLADFKGRNCYVGVDLSSGGDLTSISLVFPYYVNDVKKYYVWSHSYMPSNSVKEHITTDHAPYDMWIKEGLITVTETLGGIKTDYKYIISELEKIVKDYEFQVEMICYDSHNASGFIGDLESLGYDCLEIKQTAKVLSDATTDFRLEIRAGNVEHDGNGVLTYALANAKTIMNSYKEIKIDKEAATERIDPVDAVIDAWVMAMKDDYKIDVGEMLDDYFEMMNV